MADYSPTARSGWCSGITGDQCHVNRCLSPTCQCPRRANHLYPVPLTKGEPVQAKVPGTPTQREIPEPATGTGRYSAVELADGTWQVLGPDGQPAKISGQTIWATEEQALVAERNGNRRKAVRNSSR